MDSLTNSIPTIMLNTSNKFDGLGVVHMIPEQRLLFADYELKFKALADQKRLAILYEINRRSEVCVCELEGIVDLPQSKLSYHLRLLLDADLLKSRKEGRWNYYRLNEKVMKDVLSDDVCCILYPPGP